MTLITLKSGRLVNPALILSASVVEIIPEMGLTPEETLEVYKYLQALAKRW